jgi:hypothetical protein
MAESFKKLKSKILESRSYLYTKLNKLIYASPFAPVAPFMAVNCKVFGLTVTTFPDVDREVVAITFPP